MLTKIFTKDITSYMSKLIQQRFAENKRLQDEQKRQELIKSALEKLFVKEEDRKIDLNYSSDKSRRRIFNNYGQEGVERIKDIQAYVKEHGIVETMKYFELMRLRNKRNQTPPKLDVVKPDNGDGLSLEENYLKGFNIDEVTVRS